MTIQTGHQPQVDQPDNINNNNDTVIISDDLPPSSHFNNRKVWYPVLQLLIIFFLAIFNMTPQWSHAPQIDSMLTYALVTAVLAILWMVITAAHSAVIMCGKNMTFLPDDLLMRKMGLMVYYIIFAVIYTPLAVTYFFLTMITMSQKKRIMLIDMEKFDYNLGYWMFAISAILMIIQAASSIFDCIETWQDIAKARRAVRNEKINAIKGKYQQQDSQV